MLVIDNGLPLEVPGKISLTSTVPVLVPSLFHSSLPFTPSVALKYKMPLTFVSAKGKKHRCRD